MACNPQPTCLAAPLICLHGRPKRNGRTKTGKSCQAARAGNDQFAVRMSLRKIGWGTVVEFRLRSFLVLGLEIFSSNLLFGFGGLVIFFLFFLNAGLAGAAFGPGHSMGSGTALCSRGSVQPPTAGLKGAFSKLRAFPAPCTSVPGPIHKAEKDGKGGGHCRFSA